MKERLRLITQHGLNFRMRVAQRIHRQSAEEVEIPLSGIVDQMAALAANRKDGEAFVSGNQNAFFELRYFVEFHHFFTIRVPMDSFAASALSNPAGVAGDRMSISLTPRPSVRAQERSFGIMPSRTTPRPISPRISPSFTSG